MTTEPFPFPHRKLTVYRVALKMAEQAKVLADRVLRGFRKLADHLVRAASSTVLLIAEGANRYSSGTKRMRYGEARGECGEAAAAAELLAALKLVPQALADDFLTIAGRVGAMLTKLIQRHS